MDRKLGLDCFTYSNRSNYFINIYTGVEMKLKENTNITEVAHKEIARLQGINSDLLEACKIIRNRIETGLITTRKKDVELLDKAIKKAKGEKWKFHV